METFRIDGLADLEKQLLDFPVKVKKTMLGAALANGCKPIQTEIKNQCPVSAEAHYLGNKGTKGRILIRPGDLKRKGIKVRILKEKETSQRLTAGIYISKKYFYWRFVEYGHVYASKARSRAERAVGMKDWHQGFVPAHPFIRPAEPMQRENAIRAFKEYLAARLDVASAGGKWKNMKTYLKLNGA